jgi:hypothetical protein
MTKGGNARSGKASSMSPAASEDKGVLVLRQQADGSLLDVISIF